MLKVLHFISIPGLQDKALMCLLWPNPLWGVQLSLEDLSMLVPLSSTLAKHGGGAGPLGFSFLLENMQSELRFLSGLFLDLTLVLFP